MAQMRRFGRQVALVIVGPAPTGTQPMGFPIFHISQDIYDAGTTTATSEKGIPSVALHPSNPVNPVHFSSAARHA